MKATSILKPLEFSLETTGETWTQGSKLQGILRLKNQSSENHSLKDYKIALAYADIKKVHAKTAGCFKVNDQISLTSETINANQSLEVPFEFKLDPNLPVSDKKASFHLLYGNLETPFHLQIPIMPQPLYLEMVKLFDTFFRFKLKEYKGTLKGIDFIFIPPSSREFATLELLILSFITEGENLKLDFTFNLKKIDLTGVTNKMVKEVKVVSKTLPPKDYLMGKTHLDQDKLLKCFELILNEIKPRHLL